ncbi:hypothetical protein SUGI_0315640 [Cryptomeria japonica]|nr:hypothetical protein SUGI_0315640 [Cryptomeria japonica]
MGKSQLIKFVAALLSLNSIFIVHVSARHKILMADINNKEVMQNHLKSAVEKLESCANCAGNVLEVTCCKNLRKSDPPAGKSASKQTPNLNFQLQTPRVPKFSQTINMVLSTVIRVLVYCSQ